MIDHPDQTARATRTRRWSRRVTIVLAVVALSAVAWTSAAWVADAATAVLAQQESGKAQLNKVISNLRNVLVYLLVGLATLFLTVGAVRYLAADGDPGEIDRAKKSLRNAAIGYGLAALAPVVVAVLRSVVG